MSFFDKIFEKPKQSKPDEIESGKENLKVIRSLKKEFGDSHVEKELDEAIEKGATKGEYILDERETELENLSSEYEELGENIKVQNYLNESLKIVELQDERKKLEAYLKRVLEDSNSEETDYNEKVLQLAANKKDQEYATKKIEEMDQETLDLVSRFDEIEKRMQEIKEEMKNKYGNQDIKTEQGQYLN